MLYLICTFIANVAGDWVFFIAAILFFVSDLRLFWGTRDFLEGEVKKLRVVMHHRLFLHIAGVVFALIWFGFAAKPCADLGLEFLRLRREQDGDIPLADLREEYQNRDRIEEILERGRSYNEQGAAYCANLIFVSAIDFTDMALNVTRTIADTVAKFFVTKVIAVDLILRATFFVEGKGTNLDEENRNFMESYNNVVYKKEGHDEQNAE